MIRVAPAPEPPTFDARVRQPGLRAIAELVGEPAAKKRPGPKRAPVATRREDLKPEHFPAYWQAMSDDLLSAYGRICAYACLYIERLTGAATVDHWAPKSTTWNRVYEWDNYRLACAILNARKKDYGDVLDPFAVEDGLFALDLVSLKAVPGPAAGARTQAVKETIRRLHLDSSDYAEALGDYLEEYRGNHISLAYLAKRAPFLARELRRQGQLRAGDV